MKMKFYLIVLSLLAVCLWGTGDVRAQSASRSMTVTGKVVDQNGAAVKDGRRTVAVVNVSREPRRVRIECPGWERFRQAIRYRYGEGLMRTEGDHTLLPDATGLRIDFRSGAEYDMPGESMILLTEQND